MKGTTAIGSVSHGLGDHASLNVPGPSLGKGRLLANATKLRFVMKGAVPAEGPLGKSLAKHG